MLWATRAQFWSKSYEVPHGMCFNIFEWMVESTPGDINCSDSELRNLNGVYRKSSGEKMF